MMAGFRKKRISIADLSGMKKLIRSADLHTVCEEACCPNRGECFARGTATFLILGNICTRTCTFCAVEKGMPGAVDQGEPQRVADAVYELGLRYAVITSVTRDDLADGGASHFAATIEVLRGRCPSVKIEVLVPDFQGNSDAVATVTGARPYVFNHNLETVPRLYPAVRAKADYRRSLSVLQCAAQSGMTTKSGLMLGLGESREEIAGVMSDLRSHGCDILTLGQYLAPTSAHHPVVEHIEQKVFDHYKRQALAMGFVSCVSGPYVRSSYMADSILI